MTELTNQQFEAISDLLEETKKARDADNATPTTTYCIKTVGEKEIGELEPIKLFCQTQNKEEVQGVGI